MLKTLTGLLAVAALAAPATALASETYDCGSNDPSLSGKSLAFNGKQYLWPPNHKYVPYSITATTSNGEDIRLTLAGTSSQWILDDNGDPVDEWNGSGHTNFLTDISPNPAEGTGASPVTVDQAARAERSGRLKEGRTYKITATAEYGALLDGGPLGSQFVADGQKCTHDFIIFVPHDMGQHS